MTIVDESIRNSKIISKRIEGKTIVEISKEVPCSTTTVQKVLSSDEAKLKMQEARSKILSMVDLAADVIVEAMNQKHNNMNAALKAAIAIMESAGAITKNVQHSVDFPRPTVIKRIDGSVVEIGVESGENQRG